MAQCTRKASPTKVDSKAANMFSNPDLDAKVNDIQEEFNRKMDSNKRSAKQILCKIRRLRQRQESLHQQLLAPSKAPVPLALTS